MQADTAPQPGTFKLRAELENPFEADGVGDLFPECPAALRPRVRPGLIQNDRPPEFVKRGRVAHFEQENPQPRAGDGGVNFSDEHISPVLRFWRQRPENGRKKAHPADWNLSGAHLRAVQRPDWLIKF